MVVGMAVIAVLIKIDEERVVQGLQEAGEKLDSAEGEVVVDFSSVRRIDPSAIRALEGFADTAADRGVKVVLRSVNVDVYKVLKLVKLGSRFSFAA
jgi:anti-anti-sigma regulatory factor